MSLYVLKIPELISLNENKSATGIVFKMVKMDETSLRTMIIVYVVYARKAPIMTP